MGVAVAVGALAMIMPPSYTASGAVLVEYGKSPTFRSEPSTWPLQSAEMVETESEVIKSRGVAEAVVDKLGLDRRPIQRRKPTNSQVKLALYAVADTIKEIDAQFMDWGLIPRIPRREKVIRSLQKGLKVKQPALTVVLKVSYSSEDPELAEQVARTVIETYLERRGQIYADDSATFYMERIEESQKELEKARAELERETEKAQTDRLRLQIRALEMSYLFYKEKYDRARADAAADRSLVNVRVVDYPKRPVVANMAPLTVMVMGVAGGIFLAVGLALVLEYFDNTVYTPSDLTRRLDVPVLGSVGYFNGARWLLRTRARRAPKGGKAGAGAGAKAGAAAATAGKSQGE